MILSEIIRDWILSPVMVKLTTMEAEIMAATQADLDAAIKAIGDLITSEDSGITAIITAVNALIAKIQSGATPADLTTEVTAINSMVADITTQAANIQAALAKSKPITG